MGREHLFFVVIKMETLVASPLNMAHVCIIISQLGLIFPRSRTIHVILSTPLDSYSTNHYGSCLKAS